ncbi:MAG: hypothetical protein Q7U04_07460 [Bacteriovorax sp.]|nr:hypothetical protein [Bacteriovorax sp.]
MTEIAMCVCLAIMGIYFFKSTDLPKELKERSAQMQAETSMGQVVNTSKMSITTKMPKMAVPEINHAKLLEMSLLKKSADLKLHYEAIDKLTLTITFLEQEIKANNDKNSEIQKMIDIHLVTLEQLQEKVTSLS